MMATVTESLGTLEVLNCSTKTWDPLLVQLVQLARLLDQDTRSLGSKTRTIDFVSHFKEF